MKHHAICSEHAPQPVGPYSQAVRSGASLYLSGQIGIDPRSGRLVEGGVEAQARQVFANMAAVLKAAGGDFSSLVKVTVFILNMADFKVVNAVYADHFQKPYPARSTIAVAGLPFDAAIEIEAVAVLA